MSLDLNATGFKELEAVLLEMGDDLCYGKTASKVLIPAVKAAMMPVLNQARTLAPYDEKNSTTKHLKDTLRIGGRIPSARDKRSAFVSPTDAVIGEVSVRTDKRGISQEFGNNQVKAQPYLRPALESQSQAVVNILGTFLAYKIDQYKSKKA